MTASTSCREAWNSTSTNFTPPAPAAYVFTPATPRPRSAAAITASLPSSSRSRSRGRFSISPAACRRNDPSTASRASPISKTASTSSSVRYSGMSGSLLREARGLAPLPGLVVQRADRGHAALRIDDMSPHHPPTAVRVRQRCRTSRSSCRSRAISCCVEGWVLITSEARWTPIALSFTRPTLRMSRR